MLMLTNKCFKEQKFISGFSYELTFLFSPLKISLSCILFNLFFFACLTLFIFLIQFQGFFFPFFLLMFKYSCLHFPTTTFPCPTHPHLLLTLQPSTSHFWQREYPHLLRLSSKHSDGHPLCQTNRLF